MNSAREIEVGQLLLEPGNLIEPALVLREGAFRLRLAGRLVQPVRRDQGLELLPASLAQLVFQLFACRLSCSIARHSG